MRTVKLFGLAGVLLLLSLTVQPATAAQDFLISCEGTESGGGGAYAYQYRLQNISGVTVTLSNLFVATGDPNPANYTFIPTGGFTASIVPNDGTLTNILYMTRTKTPHGVVPTASEDPAAAIIRWSGSAVISPGGTIVFRFDHPNASHDAEWHCNSSGGWTISQYSSPIAGPMGVYTDGYVHAPIGTRGSAMSVRNVVLLAAAVALAATLVLLRSRRRVKETV